MFAGGCHCGNLRIAFWSEHPASRLPVRACQCSFCRRHAALATTDPGGRLRISAEDPALVSRYLFGFETAEYLVCGRCGVYVAAVTRADPRTGIAIVNALDDRAAFTATPVATVYDDETRDERLERRRRTWTPAELLLPHAG
jgi:hypothetical protein